MAIRKHGVGEVLPEDDEPAQHTASQQWSDEDEQALQEEGEK